MLQLTTNSRVFVHRFDTDMRKSFDGLHAIVKNAFDKDVFNGDLFVFFNRSKDRCKILLWDRDGLVVWAKRLERGTFQSPLSQNQSTGLSQNQSTGQEPAIEIDATRLSLILSGIELGSVQRRKRYSTAA
jgi:transposase